MRPAPQGRVLRTAILIPAYGAALQLRTCLASLSQFAPADCTISVLDDATPDDSIRQVCEEAAPSLPQLHYVSSQVNRGFVNSCNWGAENLREPEDDLLLLNSNTEVTAGFLEELRAVLYLHERHGVVSPRSNSATIFSIPHLAWTELRNILPRYQIMPTAARFCMLIKAEILKHFGLFDEIYSAGCDEENDFVCRINRYGYSALAANRAYVFCHESSSLGPRRAALEENRSQILQFRYPEYERKVADYL